MYYSKEKGGFIPEEWITDGTYKELPADAIEMTDEEISTFHKAPPPEGKCLGVEGGRLAWVDLPPPSDEDLIAAAEQKKQNLRTIAEEEIAPLSRAVKLGVATDEERDLLTKWEMYTVLLMRVNPKSPSWPEKP